MYCRKCGREIAADSVFCAYCGEATNSNEQERQIRIPVDHVASAAESKKQETAIPVNVTANHIKAPSAAGKQPSQMTVQSKANHASKRKPEKPRFGLIFGVSGGIIAFFLVISLFITIAAVAKGTTAFFDYSTDFTVENSNQMGNTPANSLCFGIAAMQDDTIYYLYEGMDTSQDKLKAIDLNGNDGQVYLTFDGEISDLNVIGSQLFFVGDTYDADYNHLDSGVYVYDLSFGTLEDIFVTDDTIYNLYVLSDQIYFNVSAENGSDQIVKTDFDGFDIQTIVEKPDYINGFAVFGDSLYYVYQETLFRSNLSGQNETKIYSSSNTLDAYCVVNDTIYLADHAEANQTVLKKVDANGGNETELAVLSEDANVWYLNVVDHQIYYIQETTDENNETVNSKICSIQTDGSGKQLLVSSKEVYYGLAICGGWLFSYDNEKMKTIKIDINDTGNNSI